MSVCEAGIKGMGPIGFPVIVEETLHASAGLVAGMMRELEAEHFAARGEPQ